MSTPAMEQTYADTAEIIERTARAFARRYNVRDTEDLLADARYHFLEAYNGHDPSRGPFNNRVRSVVWNRLLDERRRGARTANRLRRRSVPLTSLPADVPAPADSPGAGLSADARTVVRLLSTAETAGLSAARVRSLLADQLRDLGWAAARVRESFAEIRRTLA